MWFLKWYLKKERFIIKLTNWWVKKCDETKDAIKSYQKRREKKCREHVARIARCESYHLLMSKDFNPLG